MLRLSSVIVAILAIPSSVSAGFVTVNFNSLAINDAVDDHLIGPTYSSNGFTLTATDDPSFNDTPIFVFNGTQSNIYPGATALFHHISGGEITLTRTGGGTFNFASIDLAELPSRNELGNPIASPPFSINFTGTFADGSTVTQTANVSSFLTLSTSSFTAFQNVESVTWFQGTGGLHHPTHQFDNLVVEATPEPSSLLMAAIGLFVIVGRQATVRRMSMGHEKPRQVSGVKWFAVVDQLTASCRARLP